MTLFEGNLPQKTTEREREKKKQRERAREKEKREIRDERRRKERASKAPQVAFLSSDLPVL